VALSGILLLHLQPDTVSAVRLTSAILAGAMIIGMIAGIRSLRRLDREARGLLNRRLFWFNLVGGPIIILVQCLNAAFYSRYAEAILIGGLILVLLSAAITFSHIIGMLIKARHDAA
jgi:hypothetical protein